MHGGLSPDLYNLDQIRNLKRPTDIPDSGPLCGLLWSDPCVDVKGWSLNDRGVLFTFGADVVTEFLEKPDLDLVCRAHQVAKWVCWLMGKNGLKHLMGTSGSLDG